MIHDFERAGNSKIETSFIISFPGKGEIHSQNPLNFFSFSSPFFLFSLSLFFPNTQPDVKPEKEEGRKKKKEKKKRRKVGRDRIAALLILEGESWRQGSAKGNKVERRALPEGSDIDTEL